ncbi:hypothetical protein T01_12204 [Trichinella spiralis]|uniref:Uncharacterized protein n=1 Tax=Trichinella spiralis TaxID=6334 RepID=A0A0V1BN67_TRISP|nr:hypothetical protein T01_12204 [Trichinella spiralis]
MERQSKTKHEERASLLTLLLILRELSTELTKFSESHDTIETVTILQFMFKFLHDKSNEKFANHFYDKNTFTPCFNLKSHQIYQCNYYNLQNIPFLVPVAKTSYD